MLITASRQMAALMLSQVESSRKPFLRRSLREDALLTTDLPRAATAQACEAFARTLQSLGWRVERIGTFLELTPPLMPPPLTDMPAFGLTQPKLRRLQHMLTLHPSGDVAQAEVLALMKAEEAGDQALEDYANALCHRCAVLLRRHGELPGALLPWVRAALQ